jgi:hypothetical protein
VQRIGVQRIARAGALVVLVAGCSASHSSPSSRPTSTTTTTTTAIAGTAGARACAPSLPVVAPVRDPHALARSAGGERIVGSDALSTIASRLRGDVVHQRRGWVMKVPWFTRPFGIPAITARRLDGVGTFAASADAATDATGTWVASNLIFSTAGCWEVTVRFRASVLRFEVRVGPPTSDPRGP